MNLAPGEYVAVNLLFVTLLVGSYFFIRKGSKPPTVLNLQNPSSKKDETDKTPSTDVRNFSSTEYRPRPRQGEVSGQRGPAPKKPAYAQNSAADSNEKDLNILFNWNGHTWDAYEVLELPAGSSRVAVQKAFEYKKRKVDPESVPFITAAYKAIIQRI